MVLWTLVYKYLLVPICNSFGCLPRSGIPGKPYSESLFNFLRNRPVASSCCCVSFDFPINRAQGLYFLHILVCTYLPFIFITILMSEKSRCTMALTYISSMTKLTLDIFLCASLCVSFLKKSLFKSFAHFGLGSLSFCWWAVRIFNICWLLDSKMICDLQIFSPIDIHKDSGL